MIRIFSFTLILLYSYLYSSSTKNDFNENRIPRIFLGAYFNTTTFLDFLINNETVSYRLNKEEKKPHVFHYSIIGVNNYFPEIINQSSSSFSTTIRYIKRYIILLENSNSYELRLLFWDQKDELDEKKIFLYMFTLKQSSNKKELLNWFNESKSSKNKEDQLKFSIKKSLKSNKLLGEFKKFRL